MTQCFHTSRCKILHLSFCKQVFSTWTYYNSLERMQYEGRWLQCHTTGKWLLCPTTRKAAKVGTKRWISLVLIQLRLGLQVRDLAFSFNIAPSTVSRIYLTWINFLYHELKKLDQWPSDRDMPFCFKERYPTTQFIIDATETKLETSSSLAGQFASWSSYKKANTLKGLAGMTPAG